MPKMSMICNKKHVSKIRKKNSTNIAARVRNSQLLGVGEFVNKS